MTTKKEVPDVIIDYDRENRTGFPEAIYAAGKTPLQVVTTFRSMLEKSGKALATRCSPEILALLKQEFSEVQIDEMARLAWLSKKQDTQQGCIAVLTAGTSDLYVAQEAAITLEFSGYSVNRYFDIGVAGIHRLFKYLEDILKADVVIVVAGMDGALPSVVGGLVSAPVIAVPTSVGYGTNFGGLSAILSMLNSCSAGIVVVNIDNGFGAAVAAIRILKSKFKANELKS